MDSCGECGYAYEEHRAERIAGELVGLGPRYRDRLTAGLRCCVGAPRPASGPRSNTPAMSATCC
jgi:hypothetical protein